MNLDLIVAAGYNTPERLTDFLMLDHDEQVRIYADIAAKTGKAVLTCDLTKHQKNTPQA